MGVVSGQDSTIKLIMNKDFNALSVRLGACAIVLAIPVMIYASSPSQEEKEVCEKIPDTPGFSDLQKSFVTFSKSGVTFEKGPMRATITQDGETYYCNIDPKGP